MSDMDVVHCRYQKILNSIVQEHRGYPLRPIMAFDLAIIVYGLHKFWIKTLSKLIITRAFRGLNSDQVIKQSLLVTMGPYNRSDYEEILSFVKESSGVFRHYDIGKSGWRFYFGLGNLFKGLRIVFNMPELSLKERIVFWCNFTFRMNEIDVLNKKDLTSFHSYLAFSSVHPDEAIFIAYFQRRGIDTYSLQHGAYAIYQTEIKPIDSLIYENFNVDYHLCWGQYTKDEFVKFGIPSKNIIVAGYPRKTRTLLPFVVDKKKSRNLIFLCARQVFDEKNISIIQILFEYLREKNGGLNVAIKTHPSLDQDKYRMISQQYGFSFIEGGTIGELLQDGKYEFVITYNSNAYYDAYLNNRIALRYLDEENELTQQVLDDGFSSVDELDSKLLYFSELVSDSMTWNAVADRLAYIVGYGINRYSELLDPTNFGRGV